MSHEERIAQKSVREKKKSRDDFGVLSDFSLELKCAQFKSIIFRVLVVCIYKLAKDCVTPPSIFYYLFMYRYNYQYKFHVFKWAYLPNVHHGFYLA